MFVDECKVVVRWGAVVALFFFAYMTVGLFICRLIAQCLPRQYKMKCSDEKLKLNDSSCLCWVLLSDSFPLLVE